MKKLCIFTLYDSKGPSSKYRILQYKKVLEKHYEVECYYFWGNSYVTKYMRDKKKYFFHILCMYIVNFVKRLYQIVFIAAKSDIVFFQKGCIPWIKPIGVKRLKSKGVRVVFDVDDAVWVRAADHTDVLAAQTDAVICGNKFIFEHYSRWNSHCVLIPTVENSRQYRGKRKDTFDQKVVGWIGSKQTVENLELLVEPFNALVRKHPEVQFMIISDTALGYRKRIHNCKFVKWAEGNYIDALSEITIGVMPLLQTEVNQGKCGFKLIQYLTMQKPVVATDLGENAEIVGTCGMLANTKDEWETAMETLLFHKGRYVSCQANIQKEFEEKYCFRKVFDLLFHTMEGDISK